MHEGASFQAVLTAIGICTLLALLFLLRRIYRSFVARARARRYLAGERNAERLLIENGYQIVDRQVHLHWPLWINGVEHSIPLRADLLVAHKDRQLIAEVKTGTRAPRLRTPETRRQLLEYLIAYRADGVLVVNPELGSIEEVVFDQAPVNVGRTSPSPLRSGTAPFLAGVAFGLASTIILYFIYLSASSTAVP